MPIFSLMFTPINKKQFSLFFFFLLSPLLFFAQTTLNGLWVGSTNNDSSTVRKDQLFELALTEYKGKVFGYSRSEFIVNDTLYYIVKRVKGEIVGDTCSVTDDDIISHNFNRKPDKGVKVTSTFVRNSTDSTWRLDGKWKTNKTKNYYAVSGRVSVAEEKDLSASKIFPHLEELNLANDVAFYKERVEQPIVVKIARPEGAKTLTKAKALTSNTQLNPAKPDVQQAVSFYSESVKQTTPAASLTTSPSIQPSANNINIAKPDLQVAESYLTTTVKTTDADYKKSTSTLIDNPPKTTVPTNPNLQQAESYITTTVKATDANNKKSTTNSVNAASGKPVIADPALQQAENYNNTSIASVKNNKSESAKTTSTLPNPKTNPQQTPTTATNNNTIHKTEEEYTYPEDIPTTVVKTKPATTIPTANAYTTGGNTKPATPLPTAKQTVPVKKTNGEITASAELISGRKSVFTQEVNFASDSLIIALYDNGEIDGDTVSIYLNGQLIMAKQGLKSTAIKKTINITPGNEDFSLVLFADNLGKYPPNTGMLVVYDGEDTYNLRFSSDFQKNAGIVFKRKR
ncbi:MAG: hypothetical protein RL115_800 [Bacteroidota bacterium]